MHRSWTGTRLSAVALALALFGGAAAAAPVVRPPDPPVGRPPATRASQPAAPAANPQAVARASELVEAGVSAYNDAAFTRAITILEEAARLDPRNAKGLYYLANAYWRLDDYDKATDAFNRLLRADPAGPFAADAQEWLSAEGSFEVLAGRVRAAPLLEPARPGGKRAEATMQDGVTRLSVPAGWNRQTDEVLKSPAAGEVFRLVFRRDLGGGQSATLVAEAHHRGATPAPGAPRGVPGLSDISDRILGEQGFADYQITRSKDVSGGKEQEFESGGSRGPVQGTIRGVWDGTSLLIAVALAPRGAWPAVQKQVQPAIGSLRTAPLPPGHHGGAAASPTPTPTASASAPPPTPNAPPGLMPRPGDPTLPPGLYPAPWATPAR